MTRGQRRAIAAEMYRDLIESDPDLIDSFIRGRNPVPAGATSERLPDGTIRVRLNPAIPLPYRDV